MGRIRRASPYTEHEQAASVLPHGAKFGDAFLAVGRVDPGHNLGRFLKVLC
jgi:hypothetical protein